MQSRIAVLTLTLLIALGLTGCVYYNTFYHARAAAREAELLRETRTPGDPPGSTEMELLDRVAEKCTRVLDLHPDSSWADDALLLLGKTRYYQGRFESAEEHLTLFLSRYPNSELRPEAEFLLASVLIDDGNPESAESILEGLADASSRRDLADDALMLIGQARSMRKKYDEAAEAFTDALARFPKSDRRAEIRFLAAENYEDMGDFDAAARQYQMVTDEHGSRTLAFEARIRLARVDIESGRAEQALEVLGELERRTEETDELDRVLLLRGRALESLGRFDDAVSNYEDISASHQRSEASAESRYRIGLILRDQNELLQEATESFKKAREEAPRSEVAAAATAAARDTEVLMGYLATIRQYESAPPQDSLDVSEQAPVGEGPRNPASPDTAETVETRTSTVRPDTAATDQAWTSTVSQDTAAVVTDTIGLPQGTLPAAEETAAAPADSVAEQEPESKIAVARFRAAELYMFRFNDPERAVQYYQDVAEQHPDSRLAPKATLAVAWIYDRKLANPSQALISYEAILHDYPGTEFAEAARESLAGVESRSQR
ncbi:MAG: tetratricopeptide repeat protein [Candidatus Eisenbacteria bacterium]|nr:tetratricopeptide repeat protein [Candidatus Eisenbacteria bacterium]